MIIEKTITINLFADQLDNLFDENDAQSNDTFMYSFNCFKRFINVIIEKR